MMYLGNTENRTEDKIKVGSDSGKKYEANYRVNVK
jgi:hypothetical protein